MFYNIQMRLQSIDPESPIPLYHQIAEAIRARIETGELSAGDALEPLREAGQTWGVNLHTVRHAYTALARQGLVESRGPRGTRVTARTSQRGSAPASSTPDFIERVVQEARATHGLDATQLAREVAARAGTPADRLDVIYLVECNVGQCEAHAREIKARFDVDAREWSLERDQEPPPGRIIATYFHYNDIRRLWPHRLREVRFVTIAPDRRILGRLPAGVNRVLVCERDEATAETVAADLSVLLGPEGYRVEPVVSTDPVALVAENGPDVVALCAPRVWSALTESARSNERVMAADYVIDPADLGEVAHELRWPELSAKGRA
jgi:DNA-binding transcriptional regulator YhcF (GntR family)